MASVLSYLNLHFKMLHIAPKIVTLSFHMVLKINGGFFLKKHCLVRLCNGDVVSRPSVLPARQALKFLTKLNRI